MDSSPPRIGCQEATKEISGDRSGVRKFDDAICRQTRRRQHERLQSAAGGPTTPDKVGNGEMVTRDALGMRIATRLETAE